MSDLGRILLQMRLVTREQLEEAMDAQILNGGRLGTNLVELGFLTETQLADALQTLHRVPTLHGEIVPSESALKMIKPEWCDKHNLVPLRLEGSRLYIGLLTPYTAEQLQLLGQRLGVEVQQVVIPEFRMNQLLRRYAKAFRPVRHVDLTHAGRANANAAPAAEKAEPQELMSEDEFQQLYAQAMSGGRHSSLEELHAEHDRAHPTDHGESPLHGLGTARVPTPRGSPVSTTRPPQPPSAAPQAPLTPITFAEAQALLSAVHDREGIAQVVMRFAASKFTRALLLTIHGGVATGWEGIGEGLAGNRARRVAIPLAAKSPFKLVHTSRSQFVGPVQKEPSLEPFFKQMGGAPQTALLMPVLARGRVVNILYADHGPGRPTTPDVGELLLLTQRVGRAYEEFLAQRKQAQVGRTPVP